jgi:hypothetical protein
MTARSRTPLRLLSLALLLGSSPALASVSDLIDRLRSLPPGLPVAPQSLGQAPQRQVRLNGFPLHVTTGQTTGTLDMVLTFYQSHLLQPAKESGAAVQPLILRRKSSDSVYLVSVLPRSAEELRSMLKSRGPLASAGPVRVVYAQRSGSYTNYLALWTDAPIPPQVLQPDPTHDAPGSDLPEVPRPLGMRTFSIDEPAAGYSLVAYHVNSPPAAALASTVERLRQHGFRADPALQAVTAATENPAQSQLAHLSRAGRSLLVSVRPDTSPQAAVVTYVSRTE